MQILIRIIGFWLEFEYYISVELCILIIIKLPFLILCFLVLIIYLDDAHIYLFIYQAFQACFLKMLI